ncbi:MAG: hypothetical protein IID44_22820 [Planctomycetes bacterium]|nr:hypothetical protein [Planctomycetota bacterium]
MTSIRHRVLIDECLPPALISAYLHEHIALSRDGVDAVHISEYLGRGKKDPDWVSRIARDRRWCILSVDRERGSRRDALPVVCFKHEVTLICISSPVMKQGITFYGPQLLANWASIMDAITGPKGAQYLLRQHNTRADVAHLQAVKPPKGYVVEKGVLVRKASRKRKT